MALALTTHSLKDLQIEFSAPVETSHGLEVTATVNGQPFSLVLHGPDYLSCRPTQITINGVRYDVGWWTKKQGGNPHGKVTPGGWTDRGLRLQRCDSNKAHDHTTGAWRLACRLMDRLAELVAADGPLNVQAVLVEPRRLAAARRIDYERLAAQTERALSELVTAEQQLDALQQRSPGALAQEGIDANGITHSWAEITSAAPALALPEATSPRMRER